MMDIELTPKETEVIQTILAGHTENKELARELVIGVSTIDSHLLNIYSKIGMHNRTKLVLWALRNGFQLPETQQHSVAT